MSDKWYQDNSRGALEDLDMDAEVDFGDDARSGTPDSGGEEMFGLGPPASYQDDSNKKKSVANPLASFKFGGEQVDSRPGSAASDGGTGAADLYAAAASSRRSSKRRSTFHLNAEDEDYVEDDARFLVDEGDELDGDLMDEDDEDDAALDPEKMVFQEPEEEVDPVVKFREELMKLQDEIHCEEWNVLDQRQRLSGIVEPSVLGTIQMPPDALFYARLYNGLQSVFALLLPYSLLMLTGVPATKSLGQVIFTVTTIGVTVDIIIRIATFLPRRSKFVIGFDLLVSVASLVAVGAPEALGNLFIYISMLRAIHVFRFLSLFRDNETFRDVYLVQLTITSSVSVLMIVMLFAFIAVFIGSTFLWASESSRFDVGRNLWLRFCSADVPCDDDISPFQSIPGALWFAINCITLTGAGDAFPASALGRVIAGLCCVAGVFALSFPTTILIGNLGIVRNTFFKEESIREARIMAEAIERITDQLDAAGGEHSPQLDKLNLDLRDLEAKANKAAGVATTDAIEDEDAAVAAGFGPAGSAGLPNDKFTDALRRLEASVTKRLESSTGGLPPSGEFRFMSATPRKVAMLGHGIYSYLPILQLVHAPDGLPLLGNVTKVDDTTSTVTLFLCIDNVRAQQAALSAITGELEPAVGKNGLVARATPIVSMSVRLERAHPAIKLFHRVDVGEVVDHFVPLVFLVHSAHKFQTLQRLRKAFVSTKLMISYSPAVSAGAVWSETMFVTADMLSETKFIEELKSRSVMVAPTIFFNEEERDDVDDEDFAMKQRKNIAFIHPDHIFQLLDGIFAKIPVPPGASIRNRSEILDAVLQLILLHSREIYLRHIPPLIFSSVFQMEELRPYDTLVEIDLEFFRKSEWPIGTVVVMYGYDASALELLVTVGEDATEGIQPNLTNLDSLLREYTLEDDEADAEQLPADTMEDANEDEDAADNEGYGDADRGAPGSPSPDVPPVPNSS